jgi:uncharacterized membrane protein
MASKNSPKMQTERMKALTDGVLAIVLTILVLGFDVPDHDFGQGGLVAFFAKMAEPILAYVISFGIVATYWVQHTSIFHYIEVGDRSLFWLNLLFLLPVTMLPFLTDLRAAYHEHYVVTALYAGVNIICGLLLLALWSYGNRQGLIRALPPIVERSMRRRILLGIAINAVGAAVAPIDVHLSAAMFLTLPIIYLSHRVVDSHWSDAGNDARTKA